MTNLQQSKEERDAALSPTTLRRLWFWTPIAAGGSLALLLLSTLAVPQWLALSKDQQRLNELQERRQQAELLKLQELKVVKERREALAQQEQLIKLVAGNGDGSTFLATLDLEARQTGVKLQLFEPTVAAATTGAPGAAPAPGAPPPSGGQPGAAGTAQTPPGPDGKPPPPDPMEQAGLRSRSLLLTARGTYPQLLAFLRRMELLDLLVEQKDLTLAVAGAQLSRSGISEREIPILVPDVELKMGMTLYSRKAKPTEQSTGKAPGGAPSKPPGAPG
jgi:type IV pilus assembly protein PilO